MKKLGFRQSWIQEFRQSNGAQFIRISLLSSALLHVTALSSDTNFLSSCNLAFRTSHGQVQWELETTSLQLSKQTPGGVGAVGGWWCLWLGLGLSPVPTCRPNPVTRRVIFPVIHGWRVNSMQSMWPTVGVGISPETKSSNWGKRQQNNRCPWQLTWKCLSANIPKITWIHNRWVSQKSLLVMAQKSSPAFANLKPDTVSVRFLFFFHDVRSFFQLMFSFLSFFNLRQIFSSTNVFWALMTIKVTVIMLPNYLHVLHTLSRLIIMLAHQVLSRDSFASLGNTGHCLETILVVTTLGLLLAPSVWGVMDATRHSLTYKTVPHRKEWSCSVSAELRKKTNSRCCPCFMNEEGRSEKLNKLSRLKQVQEGWSWGFNPKNLLLPSDCQSWKWNTVSLHPALPHGKFWFSGPGPPGISLTGSQVMQI